MWAFSVFHWEIILKCLPKGKGVNPIPQGDIKVEDKDAYNVALSIAQEVFGMQPDIQPQCNALTEIAAEKVLDPVMHINNLSEL